MKSITAILLAIVVSAVQVWAGSVGDAVEVRRYQSQPVPSRQPDSRVKGIDIAGRAESAAPSAAAPDQAAEPTRNHATKSEIKSLESAGTGYGHEEYLPVQTVAFEAESMVTETIHIKYEWRAKLCKRGVLCCEPPPRYSNRLWDDGGYAPPPPWR
jgi:hypothetical protein